MMRLIDAEHLKRWILARWERIDPRSEYPLKAIDILDQIDREDTIDAEPVIKCKDCKFNYANQIPSDDVCQLCVELPISKDFFCARGEKMEEVDDAPTIDAEPVRHGRWIKENIVLTSLPPQYRWHCSECGSIKDGRDESVLTPYCPKCGAKMLPPTQTDDGVR